jgi:hypothetical protein
VPLGGTRDPDISKPADVANWPERPSAGHAETAPAGPTLPTACRRGRLGERLRGPDAGY